MKKITILFLMCLSLHFSCKRSEFMPTPEGKAIVFVDSTLNLGEFMRKSPEYSLFLQAWQRSGIEKTLATQDPNYVISLFLPDNAAMEAVGLNSNTIRVTPVLLLDSIVRVHTILKQILPEALTLQSGNLMVQSLYSDSRFSEENVATYNEKYPYRHYLTIEEGNLLLNGRVSGTASACRVLKGATVFPINRVLKKPEKSIRQVLYEDGRFSMFLAIRRHNDSLYNAILGGFDPVVHEGTFDKRYVVNNDHYIEVRPMLDYLSTVNYRYNSFEGFVERREVSARTLLAPTDAAFHQAGFNSLNDLIALNDRAIPYSYDGYSAFSGYLPTDSILNYHFWGCSTAVVHLVIEGKELDINRPPIENFVLHANDLTKPFMKDLKVSWNEGAVYDHSLRNPLEFSVSGQSIQVKVKGSDAAAATILEKDIETYNGLIHVLDRLLIPKGFKLR